MEAIGCVSWGNRAALPANRLLPNGSHRRFSSSRAATAAARCESGGNRMFVFGMGFVGRFVADQLKQEGWEVFGTCRSAKNKRNLEEMGLDVCAFDVHKNKLRSLPTLQDATHVLISIPPIAGFGDPLLCLHEDLQSALNNGNLQWLCYLSSTSVYGDSGGAWVDEDYPVNPEKESSKSRFTAEKGWLDLGRDLGVAVNIFRLGGIYGPGRSALDTIIKQRSMLREQKMRESRPYTARVHVADIYQAVKASFGVPTSGRRYNVVDDDPAPRSEVFAYAKGLIDGRWPDMIRKLPPSADDVDLQFQKGKRVSNARMKEELGVRLVHPTYRSGLQSIFDSWQPPHSDQP